MEIIKLKSLLANDEGPKLDFKEKIQLDTEGEKKEFVKDVLAIANSKGGRGYIIFGVEDKTKKLIGISKNDITEETIQQIISSRCEPPVSIKFEQLTVDNKLIGVLTIYKSNLRPHQMIQNGVFYIRRGSTTDVARRDEIATMLQESGIVNFELSIIRKAKLNDLCPSLIMKFFDKNGIKANWDNIMLLDSFGIVQKDNDTNLYCPTLGGLLVFGERPDIFIPSAYITVNIFDKIEIVNGNISTMIKKIDNLFKNIFKESELNSLIELVANALVHRDYYDISRNISIVIDNKCFEITNPGSLLDNYYIYKIGKDNITRRRNPWIYQKMIVLDEFKVFLNSGKGINILKRKYPNMKVLNLYNQNIFKVIVPIQNILK